MDGKFKMANWNSIGTVMKTFRGFRAEFKASLKAVNALKGVRPMHVDASDEGSVVQRVINAMNASIYHISTPKHQAKGSRAQMTTKTMLLRMRVLEVLMTNKN